MAYTGPGDIAGTGANGCWYGLRGFSAAYAAPGTNNAIRVTRDGGSTHQDVVILTTGYMDLATATSYAAGNALHVMTLYDQSGSGTVRNLTQVTDANRPTLVISGSFPYISFDGSATFLLYDTFTDVVTGTDTFSWSSLMNPSGSTISITLKVTGVNRQSFAPNASAGNARVYNGTALSFPMTDGAWHTANASIDASNNATVYIDALTPVSGSVGAGSGTGALLLGADDLTPTFVYNGFLVETGYWDTTAFTSGNVTSIAAQQAAYQSAFGVQTAKTLILSSGTIQTITRTVG